MKTPLQRLHEEFIDAARRPMNFGRLPVSAREPVLPVVPMNKWEKQGDPKHLTKTYEFRRPDDRNLFLRTLLVYEEKVGHNAIITADEGTLKLQLMTKTTEQVTELDREYAKFADMAYKDIVTTPDSSNKDDGSL